MRASQLRKAGNPLAIAAAALLASACAATAPPRTAAIDPGAIYMRYCSACHGEKGDANSHAAGALARKPRDFTAAESRSQLTREYMIAIVRDGRPHTPMTARESRLGQEEIEAVVDYIRARFMSVAPRNPPAKAN